MKRLSKIEEIYHAALAMSPEERENFLDRQCGEDFELRREVESLLAFEEKAVSFIESPPEDLAEDFFSHRTDQDIIGKTLNNYRIISLIGAGGMGEVYLAEDIKLGRKVAIKLLPARFSENEERKGRFLREARAVSALNHPNIITVYGIEEAKGLEFIATEFIDGKTVYEKLSEGTFDWQEVLEIAIQMTDALESAHKIGIIHRDIKPANIMIRKDGYVKILDFGLAKMLGVLPDSDSFKTTELSKTNRVMGTMNYMSPEQALGKTLDARSDIFSLGTVLYEMLSGEQPFQGTSDAAVYDAILHSDPAPLSELRGDLPPALEKIIKLAIEKDRSERYQSISEMRADLQILKENEASDLSNGNFKDYSFSNSKVFGRKKILAPTAATFAAILISTAGIYLYSNNFFIDQNTEVKNLGFTQLTSEGGEELFPSLSPDGKNIIYSSKKSGNWDIYLRRVNGANTINLTEDESSDDRQAVFSPNGEKIAFRSERSGGGIFIMGATGESVRRVSDTGFYPSWSPDGKEIVFTANDFDVPTWRNPIVTSLWIVDVSTGEKRKLTTKGDAIQPDWSPNGKRIAFWSVNRDGTRDVKTISAKGGEPVSVIVDEAIDWNPVWSRDGKYLYFASDRSGSMNLWRVRIDEETGKTLGELESINTPSSFSQHLTVSKDGKRFAYVFKQKFVNILRYDFDPVKEVAETNPTEITKGANIYQNPYVSPDNEWIVFDAIRNKQRDLFIMRKDGTDIRQVTNDVASERGAFWSPDGTKIISYSDNRSNGSQGWVVNSDGSNLKQITNFKDGNVKVVLYSPDGKEILVNIDDNFPLFIKADTPFSEQTPRPMLKNPPTDYDIMATSWSPDGNRIIGDRDGDDASGIISFDIDTEKYQHLTDFGYSPNWLNDSKRAIFFDAQNAYILNTTTRKTKKILSVEPNYIQNLTISPDNLSVYIALEKNEADIWLATIAE